MMKTVADPIRTFVQYKAYTLLSDHCQSSDSYNMRWAKRITDLLLSAMLLTLFVPLMVIVAGMIKLLSPGPFLFKQKRIGKNGNPFTFYKFRTMFVDTDHEIHEKYIYQQLKASDKAERELYKMAEDPRITKLGYFLRKSSIDELPQLWNVFRGDMSLVGPRPPIDYEVENYDAYQRQRLYVVPGITGLWQVSGRSKHSYKKMIDLDIEYISKQSWIGDIIILFKTLFVIFRTREAA